MVLFGGRDGRDNFGDLWIFDLHDKKWSDPVCIGSPPAPRHGHTILSVADDKILVMGGCCVSPFAETGTPDNIDDLDDQLALATKRVAECYELEKAESIAAGIVIESEADFINWKQIARLSAQASAAIAKREKDTNDAENDLNILLQERAAAIHWAKMNAEHGRAYVKGVHDHKYMDVVLLDITTKVWMEPTAPPCTGKLPLARMNHTAVNIAGKIIVVGGCSPTTTRVTLSDNDVHVLDIESWKWTIPAVEDTPYAMLPTLNSARTAVRRADRMLEDELGSARSRGIPGGRSLEVAEAEAVSKVCKWRLRTLQEQCSLLQDPPGSRYGHATVAMGQRLYFIGGFEIDHAVGSGLDMIVLDLEQPDERERRLREEFHAKLERERRIQEFEEEQRRKQKEYEDRVRKEAEMRREAEETRKMEFEDMLSRLPPKTFAPTVKLKYANKHTIWLQWDRVTKNSEGNYLGPNDVVYNLFARGGFVALEVGMEVFAQYVGTEKEKKKMGIDDDDAASIASASWAGLGGGSIMSGSIDDLSVASAEPSVGGMSQIGQFYPGKIIRDFGSGQFYVHYEVGGKEKVPRWRILPRKIPEWELVYSGTGLTYAYESSIPDFVLEREVGITVNVEFVLQTVGTEFPIEEPSLHGEQVSFATINRDGAVKTFYQLMEEKKERDSSVGDGDTEIVESRTKKKLREAVKTDYGVIESWQNGQVVEGRGVGNDYV